MPYISKADHTQLLDQLAVVNARWKFINRFLADMDEELTPLYAQWMEQQKSEHNLHADLYLSGHAENKS